LAQAEVIKAATSNASSYAVVDAANTIAGAAGSATQILALQNATSVTVNASPLQAQIDMAGFSGSKTVNLTINGNTRDNTITGGDGTDIISANNGNDTILGGLGNDTITGGSNNDTFVFNTTLALNGSDTVTDFTTGTNSISFLYGDGGINQADLRGNGTGYLELAAGGTIGTNSGVVVISTQQSDLSQITAQTLAAGLVGTVAGDQFYLAFDNGTDTAIYRMLDTNSNPSAFETAELIVTLSSVSDADTVLDSNSFGL
jgi:hypothetical protein